MLKRPWLYLLVVATFLVAITVVKTPAQTAVSGTWTASLNNEKTGKIQLNFERRTQRGSRSQMGQSYDFADLQGLSSDQASGSGPVKFSLVREAGRIDCEGNFQNGKGSGTFTFTPSSTFVSAMKSRGFDFEQDASRNGEQDLEERLFAATTLNVTTALADDLNSANFGKLQVEDLFKAAIFKVDSNFMREMKASGFEKEPFESLVKMRIFKVTPEFITEVRNEGITNLTIEDAVKMKIFKIDTEFIREAKADGVPLEVERLVQRKIGVARR